MGFYDRETPKKLFSLLHRACCRVTQLLYQLLHIYKIYNFFFFRFRINQEIKFQYRKKQHLNQRLYYLHLEGAHQYNGMLPQYPTGTAKLM